MSLNFSFLLSETHIHQHSHAIFWSVTFPNLGLGPLMRAMGQNTQTDGSATILSPPPFPPIYQPSVCVSLPTGADVLSSCIDDAVTSRTQQLRSQMGCRQLHWCERLSSVRQSDVIRAARWCRLIQFHCSPGEFVLLCCCLNKIY